LKRGQAENISVANGVPPVGVSNFPGGKEPVRKVKIINLNDPRRIFIEITLW